MSRSSGGSRSHSATERLYTLRRVSKDHIQTYVNVPGAVGGGFSRHCTCGCRVSVEWSRVLGELKIDGGRLRCGVLVKSVAVSDESIYRIGRLMGSLGHSLRKIERLVLSELKLWSGRDAVYCASLACRPCTLLNMPLHSHCPR
jgi:hypothetical protein